MDHSFVRSYPLVDESVADYLRVLGRAFARAMIANPRVRARRMKIIMTAMRAYHKSDEREIPFLTRKMPQIFPARDAIGRSSYIKDLSAVTKFSMGIHGVPMMPFTSSRACDDYAYLSGAIYSKHNARAFHFISTMAPMQGNCKCASRMHADPFKYACSEAGRCANRAILNYIVDMMRESASSRGTLRALLKEYIKKLVRNDNVREFVDVYAQYRSICSAGSRDPAEHHTARMLHGVDICIAAISLGATQICATFEDDVARIAFDAFLVGHEGMFPLGCECAVAHMIRRFPEKADLFYDWALDARVRNNIAAFGHDDLFALSWKSPRGITIMRGLRTNETRAIARLIQKPAHIMNPRLVARAVSHADARWHTYLARYRY